MTTTRLLRKPSFATIVAGGLVLAAGGVAWFGLTPGDGRKADSAIVTVAPGEGPEPARSVAGISTGGLPTRIVVPAADVDASISEVGIRLEQGKPAWETAWRAAGHHYDSAMPGQLGNMIITGQISVAGRENLAVFYRPDRVSEGDLVEVYSGELVHRYQVNKVMVVSANAVKLLRSDSTATVTLVTCTKDLKSRLAVVGTLVV